MKWTQIAWRAWLPLALLAVWEGAAAFGVVSRIFFPPPSAIGHAAWTLAQTGELGAHVSATLGRTLAGFLVGSLTGIGAGLVMGRSRRARWSLEPLVSTLVSMPKLSLLPMLMLLLGVGEQARLALVAAAAFVVVALTTLDSIRSIDTDLVELARNHGASTWSVIRWVVVPAALPQMCTGLRLGLGRALAISVTAEILGAPFGLGNLIWTGWQTFAIEEIYVGVFAVAFLSIAFHAGMRGLEKTLVPWRS